jgi:hypothetical protein
MVSIVDEDSRSMSARPTWTIRATFWYSTCTGSILPIFPLRTKITNRLCFRVEMLHATNRREEEVERPVGASFLDSLEEMMTDG